VNTNLTATPRCQRNRQQGGVVLIIALIIATMCLSVLVMYVTRQMQRNMGASTSTSTILLSKIDIALANYVAHHRRLPCPADGSIASGLPNAGVAMTFPACTTQTRGVVPWITLGISENDARDPWHGRITYRVDPALAGAAPLLMDMSNCDVSGTGSVGAGGACRTPTPSCIANPATCTAPNTFLANKGLDVWDGIGGAAGWAARQNNRAGGTGAAYVLISHGATGAGAYNSNGTFQPGTIGPIPLAPLPGTQFAGDNEMPNLANLGIVFPATQANTYRDAPFNTTRTLQHFDDYISHPSIPTVLRSVHLQERVH
jgi:hypothetical protein